jgi:hypothetical protein
MHGLAHLGPVELPPRHAVRQHSVPVLQHVLLRGALKQAPDLHQVLIPATSRTDLTSPCMEKGA